MIRNKFWLIVSLLIVSTLLFAACGSSDETEAPSGEDTTVEDTTVEDTTVEDTTVEDTGSAAPESVQFCMVYSTSITDNGWDRSGHESFQRFALNPGSDIEILEIRLTEGLWGDEAEAAMRAYAESGCDIIWAHGGYNDIILNIYQEYPDTMFVEVGSGWIDGDENNYHYMNRCHDGSYLMGVLAGLMTDADVIGIAGGFPAEDVNDNINGWIAGAKSVRPELQAKVGFINSWYDPVAAAELAEAQKAAGADMLFMLAENFDVCGEGQDAMCFGPYIDFSELYPGAVMASFITTWDAAYEWAVEEWVLAKTTGEWNGGPLGFENSMVGGACDVQLGGGIEETLPADVLQQYNETRDAILSGELIVPLDTSEPVSD